MVGGDRLRPGTSWHTLSNELQDERRKRQELLRFAEEGEECAQESLSDLACERTLRIKADARIIQLEDRIDDRERSLDDAFIELRELRERLFAKDLQVHDLDECLKSAQSQVQELRTKATSEEAVLTTRLAQLEKSSAEAGERKTKQLATVELQLDNALDDLAQEYDLRLQSDARIDELDASLHAHGREMDTIALEFKALKDTVAVRDLSICDLQDRLKAAEQCSIAAEERTLSVAEDSAWVWEQRCSELRNVLTQVEAEAQMKAATHTQTILRMEATERQMKSELRLSEVKEMSCAPKFEIRNYALAASKADVSTVKKEMSCAPMLEALKHALAVSEAEVSTMKKEMSCAPKLEALKHALAVSEAEVSTLKKETSCAPNFEVLKHALAVSEAEVSTMKKEMSCAPNFEILKHALAISEAEVSTMKKEMSALQSNADSCRWEMNELRNELMACQVRSTVDHASHDRWKVCDPAMSRNGHLAEMEITRLRTEMLQLKTHAGTWRDEITELRAELMASRLETASYHAKANERFNIGLWNTGSGRADVADLACQTECLKLRRERERHASDLDDRTAELTRTKRQVVALESENRFLEERLSILDKQAKSALPQLDRFVTPERCSDGMDVDVAIHAAALNVAVRAELDAARKNEEQVAQAMRRESLHSKTYDNDSQADVDRKAILQEVSDMRLRNISTELHAEKAFSLETADALQDSMRALREQERLADDLRCKLDVATSSCAAARAARAAGTKMAKRVQRNNKVLAAEASTSFPRKPLYSNSSIPDRPSNLRARIEEEARLRMNFGLCGLTA